MVPGHSTAPRPARSVVAPPGTGGICTHLRTPAMLAAASRSMNPDVTIRTLTDGGQPAHAIAAAIAEFVDGAARSLELAQYDFDLGPDSAATVGGAIRRAAERGVRVRLAYNVDHA